MDWLGITQEGWFIIIGTALSFVWYQSCQVWDHYHPIKQAWCAGCDELQPSTCMRWNSIGLYRCSVCRDEPPLLDQAKALEPAFRPGAQF
jgi:hypothetical protein